MKMEAQDMHDLMVLANEVAKLPDSDPRKAIRQQQLGEVAKLYDEPITTIKPDAWLGNLMGYGGGIVKTGLGEAVTGGKELLQGKPMGDVAHRAATNMGQALNPFSNGAPSAASYAERFGAPEGQEIPIPTPWKTYHPSTRDVLGFAADMAFAGGTTALERKYSDLLKYGEGQGWVKNGAKLVTRAALNPLEETGTQIKRLQLKNADLATTASKAPRYSQTVMENGLEGWNPADELQNVQEHISNSRGAIDTRLNKATQDVLARGESLPTVSGKEIYGQPIEDLKLLQQDPPLTFAAKEAKNQLVKEVEEAVSHRPGGAALMENRDINNAPSFRSNVIEDDLTREQALQTEAQQAHGARSSQADSANLIVAGKIRARINKDIQAGFRPDPTDVNALAILESPGAKAAPPAPPNTKPSQSALDMSDRLNENTIPPASILDMPEQPQFTAQDLRRFATGHQKAAAEAGAYNVNRPAMGIAPASMYAQKQAQIGRAARDAEKNLLDQMEPGAGAAASQNYADMNSLLAGAEYANQKFIPGTVVRNTRIIPPKISSNMGVVGSIGKETLNLAKAGSYPLAKMARNPWAQLIGAPAAVASTRQDQNPATPQEIVDYYLRNKGALP